VEAKPPEEDSSLVPEDVSTEQAEASTAPVMPFDISKVDPKKIQLAEEMGIPIKQVIAWAMSVEQRFKVIAEDLATAPQKVVEALKAEAVKSQQQRVKQMQEMENQPQQSGGTGLLRQLIPFLTSGGGGMDEQMVAMTKEMMSLNIARMKQDMNFTDAIKNAIVTKMTSKTVGDLV